MKPIARIVCWNCRRWDRQLFNIKNSLGKKTEDYVCVKCKNDNPVPPTPNMSMDYMETPVVTLEGDRVS